MSYLEVEFAGLKLENPFVVASSELTNTFKKIKLAESYGASAVITKLCFLKVPFYARPYHVIEQNRGLFSPSGDRMSIEQAEVLVDQCKKETKMKIIANMMGPGEDLEGWATLAKRLEDAGADMIEMNMSCPNVGLMAKQLSIEAPPELGAALGQNPALAREVTRAVSSAVKIPVMAKMTPEANTPLVAEQCAAGGAAAVSAINCPQSLPGVDIYNEGSPLYANVTNQSFAGLCGPWIRPLAYRHVAQIHTRTPDLPIAGGGGLMNWRHVIEMIMYGATITTFCSLFYIKGFHILPRMALQVENYMKEMGYKNLSDFRGMALKHIVTPDKVNYVDDVIPEIDAGKCSGCGICTRMGHCLVITMNDKKKAVVEKPQECYGCSVCYWLCHRRAITMVNTKTGERITRPDFTENGVM